MNRQKIASGKEFKPQLFQITAEPTGQYSITKCTPDVLDDNYHISQLDIVTPPSLGGVTKITVQHIWRI